MLGLPGRSARRRVVSRRGGFEGVSRLSASVNVLAAPCAFEELSSGAREPGGFACQATMREPPRCIGSAWRGSEPWCRSSSEATSDTELTFFSRDETPAKRYVVARWRPRDCLCLRADWAMARPRWPNNAPQPAQVVHFSTALTRNQDERDQARQAQLSWLAEAAWPPARMAASGADITTFCSSSAPIEMRDRGSSQDRPPGAAP